MPLQRQSRQRVLGCVHENFLVPVGTVGTGSSTLVVSVVLLPSANVCVIVTGDGDMLKPGVFVSIEDEGVVGGLDSPPPPLASAKEVVSTLEGPVTVMSAGFTLGEEVVVVLKGAGGVKIVIDVVAERVDGVLVSELAVVVLVSGLAVEVLVTLTPGCEPVNVVVIDAPSPSSVELELRVVVMSWRLRNSAVVEVGSNVNVTELLVEFDGGGGTVGCIVEVVAIEDDSMM